MRPPRSCTCRTWWFIRSLSAMRRTMQPSTRFALRQSVASPKHCQRQAVDKMNLSRSDVLFQVNGECHSCLDSLRGVGLSERISSFSEDVFSHKRCWAQSVSPWRVERGSLYYQRPEDTPPWEANQRRSRKIANIPLFHRVLTLSKECSCLAVA